MATFTPNLSLELQGGGERASLVVLNENLTKLDTFAGSMNGKFAYTTMPSNTDLNTLTTRNNYMVGNMSQMTHAPNGCGTSGFFYVDKNSSYIYQVFYGNLGSAHRFSYDSGSTWVDWFDPNSQIDPIVGAKSWITSANLDNYTETGLYMIGATPTNAPSDWGTLQVWAPTSTLVVQNYYRSGMAWSREYRSSEGWFPWKQCLMVVGVSTPEAVQSGASATISYPTGFTMANTQIVYSMLYLSSNVDRFPSAVEVQTISSDGIHVKNIGGAAGRVILGLTMV